MSFKALRWAMSQQQPGLTSGAKIVLLVLAEHHFGKADRAPFPSLDRIGRMACISSRTTVLKHLETLEQLGLIIKCGRGNRSNEYLLSGSPDFPSDVQLLDNEKQVENDDGCSVSDFDCPVSGDGCSEVGQPMSKDWTRTRDLTRSSTKKENQASNKSQFSAQEDNGFHTFQTVFPCEPSIYAETRAAYDQAIERGATQAALASAAEKFAHKVLQGFVEPMDPADWLNGSYWNEPRKAHSRL